MSEVAAMFENGEAQKDAIRPDFNKSIFVDFTGAKITSDAGFLLMREVDQRFGITARGCNYLVDERSTSHKKHTFEQMIRQRCIRLRQVMKTATMPIISGVARIASCFGQRAPVRSQSVSDIAVGK